MCPEEWGDRDRVVRPSDSRSLLVEDIGLPSSAKLETAFSQTMAAGSRPGCERVCGVGNSMGEIIW